MGEDDYLRMIQEHKTRAAKIKLVAVAVILVIAAAVLLILPAAKAEAAPSATVQGLYKIESDGMRLSDAPVRVTIIDLAVVDIDSEVLAQAGQIVAKVYFPYVPDDGIEGIVMFDGWHLASGQFIRAGENAVIVTFKADDLREFDGTVGLYLILVGHTEQ